MPRSRGRDRTEDGSRLHRRGRRRLRPTRRARDVAARGRGAARPVPHRFNSSATADRTSAAKQEVRSRARAGEGGTTCGRVLLRTSACSAYAARSSCSQPSGGAPRAPRTSAPRRSRRACCLGRQAGTFSRTIRRPAVIQRIAAPCNAQCGGDEALYEVRPTVVCAYRAGGATLSIILTGFRVGAGAVAIRPTT